MGCRKLGAIAEQKLLLLEEEFRLGSEAITMIRDGKKHYPIGKADFICINELGQFVIIDLKTPIRSPDDLQFVYKRRRAIQLEMYALMFDTICKILGIDAGISYTGILYWNPEHNNSLLYQRVGLPSARYPGIQERYLDTKKDGDVTPTIY